MAGPVSAYRPSEFGSDLLPNGSDPLLSGSYPLPIGIDLLPTLEERKANR